MFWWLIIAAVVIAALAYGYWEHTKQSRHLAKLFPRLAARHGGAVKRGNLLVMPQYRFETEGRRLLVTSMATSGYVAAGSSGYSGPFTLVDLELPGRGGENIRVLRNREIVDRLIGAVAPGSFFTTGHAEFDAAFRIKDGDRSTANRVFDARLRDKLLQSKLPGLDARMAGAKISVHMDGYATSESELEEMIEIAILLADRSSADSNPA